MDEFLLKKQQIFHALESITFTWFIIIGTVIAVLFGYGKYRKLKMDAAIQMKMFNRNIFLADRRFFEKYGAKKELSKKDFIQMYKDTPFKEHLWRKELNYYKELVHIVESLKLIRFYELLAVILLAGVCLLEIFFSAMSFGS